MERTQIWIPDLMSGVSQLTLTPIPRDPMTPGLLKHLHTHGARKTPPGAHTCTESGKFLREKKRREKRNWRDRVRKRWV